MSYHSNCNVLLHLLPVDGAENVTIFKVNLMCFKHGCGVREIEGSSVL